MAGRAHALVLWNTNQHQEPGHLRWQRGAILAVNLDFKRIHSRPLLTERRRY